MKRWILAGILAAAACRRVPVPTGTAPLGHVDAFLVNCAGGSNCPGGTPATVFRTAAVPDGGDVMVTRNGVILYTGLPGSDYTAAVDPAGNVTVTFAAQPVTDGDVILLRYTVAAGPFRRPLPP